MPGLKTQTGPMQDAGKAGKRFPPLKLQIPISHPCFWAQTEAVPKRLLPYQDSSFLNHSAISCRQQHLLSCTTLDWVLSDSPNSAQQTATQLSCILLHATNIQLKPAQILGDDGTGFTTSHRRQALADRTLRKGAREGKSRRYWFQTFKL